jgi:hypothetical protein
MKKILVRAVVLGLMLSAHVASAQDARAQDAPRGVHVRGQLAGLGAMALPLGADGFLVGGGLSTGFELAVHPNHDIGVRGLAVWFPYDVVVARRWQQHALYQLALVYRFHDDLVVDRFAPYLEVGAGIGGYDGCLNGNFCGGFGPTALLAGGVELALHRYVSLVGAFQLRAQFGMVNGVSMVLTPELSLGLRAG